MTLKKIEPGVYDYMGYRLVRYFVDDNPRKRYWQVYRAVEGNGDSVFIGFDNTYETAYRLEDAKALVDCRIMGGEDEKENN